LPFWPVRGLPFDGFVVRRVRIPSMLSVLRFCMNKIRFTNFSAEIVGGSNRDANDHNHR
jgi:hypothetical protein